MLLTKNYPYKLGLRKRTIGPSITLGPTTVKVIVVVALALAGLFYIAQQTSSGTKGYRLVELQQDRSQLEAERERLRIEALRLKSLTEIQNAAKDASLEPIQDVQKLPQQP